MSHDNPVYFITGAMASGKSTVAHLLSERFDKSVHLRGDTFRRMIVNGRVEMSAHPTPEALHQLEVRYQAAAAVARLYRDSGFTVIYQDVVIGPILADALAMYDRVPLYLVVLCPRAEVIARREAGRDKTGYGDVDIGDLQEALRQTPRLGLWLDTSEQTPDQTVDAIVANLGIALITS